MIHLSIFFEVIYLELQWTVSTSCNKLSEIRNTDKINWYQHMYTNCTSLKRQRQILLVQSHLEQKSSAVAHKMIDLLTSLLFKSAHFLMTALMHVLNECHCK